MYKQVSSPQQLWCAGTGAFRTRDAQVNALSAHFMNTPTNLSALEAFALRYTASMQTLEEHLNALLEAIKQPESSTVESTSQRIASRVLSAARRVVFRLLLRQMMDRHLLLSESEVVDSLCGEARVRERSTPSKPINRIAVVTANRPGRVVQCVTELLKNAEHSSVPEILIIDDGDSDASFQALRRWVRSAQIRSPILYVNRDDRARLAERLSTLVDVPPETIGFALCGASDVSTRVGAARNTALLMSAGHRFLFIDDDVVGGQQWVRGDNNSGILLQGGDSLPVDARYFATRAAALETVRATSAGLMAVHERVLGRPLADLVAETANEQETILIRGALRELFPLGLPAGNGRIAISANGIVGDCGTDAPCYRVFQPSLLGRSELSDASQYEIVRASRETTHLVAQTTVARNPFVLGCAMGIDASTMVPPFPPICRSEDTIFVHWLLATEPAGYVAHLPYAVLHDADPRPTFGPDDIWSFMGRIRFADVILACGNDLLRTASDRVDLATVGDSLVQLGGDSGGHHFQELADVVGAHRLGAASRLQHLASENPHLPQWWAADALRQVDQLRMNSASILTQGCCDISPGNGMESVRALRECVSHTGELLIRWNDIWDGAVELQPNGTGMGIHLAGP